MTGGRVAGNASRRPLGMHTRHVAHRLSQQSDKFLWDLQPRGAVAGKMKLIYVLRPVEK